ncbi:hypothetical protein FOA52_004999 [Chlamydomonas sp. UWO 241]|nr:hypothetical protein FOA52_004999 [Chlamydomonas sp. UWO 241]
MGDNRPQWMGLGGGGNPGNYQIQRQREAAGNYPAEPYERSSPAKLPPLEPYESYLDGNQRGLFVDSGPKVQMAPALRFDALYSHGAPGQLEPLNMALHTQGRNQAVMEERLMRLESRVMTAEGAAMDAARIGDGAEGRLAAMAAEVARTQAELSDLRARYEGATAMMSQMQHAVGGVGGDARAAEQAIASLRAQLGESERVSSDMRAQMAMLHDKVHRGAMAGASQSAAAVAAMQGELRQADSKVMQLSNQMSELMQRNAELAGQVAMLSDSAARAAQERAAAQAAVQGLSRQFQEGASAIVEENRRAAEEANTAFRMESQRRQQAYLQDLASLNREVEGYRAEASQAGQSLHGAISQLSARVQAEEAALHAVQTESGMAAAAEAALIGGLRGEIGQLQAVLSGMGQQLANEQGMRRADAQALDHNMKAVEAAMQAAQDDAVRRTVQMIEGKAANLLRALRDTDDAATERDEENRAVGEMQVATVARAGAHKERQSLERLLVLEAALRDVAASHAGAIHDMQAKIDKGVNELAMVLEDGRRVHDNRESELREQINSALQKVRAYARDMEESLEQERIRLEEVVKMEIRARISTSEALAESLTKEVGGMRSELAGARTELSDASAVLRADLDALSKKLHVAVLSELKSTVDGVAAGLLAEVRDRKAACDALTRHMEGVVVDQKVAEEEMRTELWAVSANVDAHTRCIQEEIMVSAAAAAADITKLKSGLRAEMSSRAQLTELVAVHSDVFVDVQKKLDGHGQRLKTHDVQIGKVWTSVEDKLEAVALDMDAHKKDIEANSAAITAAVAAQIAEAETTTRALHADQQLRAQSQQTVLESVMAEMQEDIEGRMGVLQESVKANEVLLEEELSRMQSAMEEREVAAAGAAAAAATAAAAGAGEAAARVAAMLAEADEKMAIALSDASEETRANMATTKADILSALVEQRDETNAKLGEATAMVESLQEETSEKLRAQEESLVERLSAQEQALGARIDVLGTATDSALATFKESINDVLAQAQAQVETAVEDLRVQGATTEARLTSLLEDHSGSSEATLAELRGEVVGLRERADAGDATAAELANAVTAAEEAVSSLREETTEKLSEYRDRTQEELAAAAEQAQRALEDGAASTQTAMGPLEERLSATESQVGALSSALEAAKAELREAIALSGDNLAARVREESVGASAESEQRTAQVAAETQRAVAEAEQRTQQLAAEISGLRESMAEQTREMAGVLEEAEGLRSAREEAEASIAGLRTEFDERMGTLEETTGEGLQMAADRLGALERAGGDALTASDQLEALRAEVRGTDGRIAALEKGGGDVSGQLAAVRAAAQSAADGARDAAVAEALRAAASAREAAVEEARLMVDAAKATLGDEARRAAEEAKGAADDAAAQLRAAIPALMKDEMSALMRGQAVAELEARMHSALDAGLDTIRGEADRHGEALQAQVTDIRAQVVRVVGV